MTNKNNVMLDLIQHPCGIDSGRGRARSFAVGEAGTAYGFRIKSGMTNKNLMVSLSNHVCPDPSTSSR
ncbi:hypothetical protein [Inquilinus sp. CAU 1745]|uniref:hypothetical protein n=1 Tax=Inquilinus sp. CAU 1745 TaxID=3140369 RepID=UPI00325BA12D